MCGVRSRRCGCLLLLRTVAAGAAKEKKDAAAEKKDAAKEKKDAAAEKEEDAAEKEEDTAEENRAAQNADKKRTFAALPRKQVRVLQLQTVVKHSDDRALDTAVSWRAKTAVERVRCVQRV